MTPKHGDRNAGGVAYFNLLLSHFRWRSTLEVISKVEKVYAEGSKTVVACAENSAMHNGS